MRCIRLLPSFEKDWKTIPQAIRQVAIQGLKFLQEHPNHPRLDTKKLNGISPTTWRWRIGSFRILYRYDKEAIYLIRFLDRKDAYR